MSLMEMAPRETAHESGGALKGVAVALVTKNKDEEGMRRVKVSYPWHDRPSESYWARLAVPMAGNDCGFMTIPEIGDEVLVAFEREDLRFPYIIGCLWNGKDKPPVPSDDKNDKRILKSRKKHFLLFDDGAKGVVELAHVKGRRVLIDDNGFSIHDEKGNVVKVDSNSGAMTIQAKGKLHIKAASIVIEATGTLEIKANSVLTIQGNPVNIN